VSNDCATCSNAPYQNGAGGPCPACVDNSNWHNNREARHVAAAALTTQVGGNHYKDMPIQPVEYIHKNSIGYFEGCVIKYVSRWRKKNGVEDLRKARHFLDLLIEFEDAHRHV